MKATHLPFSDTQYFSKLIVDYLEQPESLSEFYSHYSDLPSLKMAAKERKFSNEQRTLLIDRLKDQYKAGGIAIEKDAVFQEQIKLLSKENTFTVTTGHQLSLMGGPLYFLYKIISTVKLSRVLSNQYKEFQFLPVFWMATEDHDFEEVDHFNFRGKKYQWKRESTGPVGRLDTHGLEEVYKALVADLPDFSTHAEKIVALFKASYLAHSNYADATRQLVYSLFGKEGVLIVDGDDPFLKRSFIPEMKEELTNFSTEKNVLEQSTDLANNYKLQVNPRKINLFYIGENNEKMATRERIEKTVGGYLLVDRKQEVSADDLFSELEKNPERFSPNVLMRPMYQEKVLPNLGYIGGGGELAYWFQLKKNFAHFNLQFPVLLLRNSCMYLNQEQSQLLQELKIGWRDLFMREGDLVKKWVIDQDEEIYVIQEEKDAFEALWEKLNKKSREEDPTLGPYVEAENARIQKWLSALSNKLIRSRRRKSDTSIRRIHTLKSQLFPDDSLQERKESMIELLLLEGYEMVPELIEKFDIPTNQFTILEV